MERFELWEIAEDRVGESGGRGKRDEMGGRLPCIERRSLRLAEREMLQGAGKTMEQRNECLAERELGRGTSIQTGTRDHVDRLEFETRQEGKGGEVGDSRIELDGVRASGASMVVLQREVLQRVRKRDHRRNTSVEP